MLTLLDHLHQTYHLTPVGTIDQKSHVILELSIINCIKFISLILINFSLMIKRLVHYMQRVITENQPFHQGVGH